MLQLTYLHNISDVRMYISKPVDVSNAHIHKRSLKYRDTDGADLALTHSLHEHNHRSYQDLRQGEEVTKNSSRVSNLNLILSLLADSVSKTQEHKRNLLQLDPKSRSRWTEL